MNDKLLFPIQVEYLESVFTGEWNTCGAGWDGPDEFRKFLTTLPPSELPFPLHDQLIGNGYQNFQAAKLAAVVHTRNGELVSARFSVIGAACYVHPEKPGHVAVNFHNESDVIHSTPEDAICTVKTGRIFVISDTQDGGRGLVKRATAVAAELADKHSFLTQFSVNIPYSRGYTRRGAPRQLGHKVFSVTHDGVCPARSVWGEDSRQRFAFS